MGELKSVTFRGRGESAYAKDPMSYVPLAYLQDVEALLAEQDEAKSLLNKR